MNPSFPPRSRIQTVRSLFITQTFTVNAAAGTASLAVTDYAAGSAAAAVPTVVAERDDLGPIAGVGGALQTATPYLGFVAHTAQGFVVLRGPHRPPLGRPGLRHSPVPASLLGALCRQYAQQWVGGVVYSLVQPCAPPLINVPPGAYASNNAAGASYL